MLPGAIAVPVDARGDDVADRAVLQALDCFDVAGLMMALQADADGKFFCLASSSASSIRRTPAASVASGFSMKMCLPALTAAAKWIGRKPGGVARITRSTPASRAF